MNKAVRRRVISFELRDNDGPSRNLWPKCSTAVLECGHRINLGVCTNYKPKRMACWECENGKSK